MTITYCKKLDFYLAQEPRTDLRVMKLNAKGHMIVNPLETPHYRKEIRVPVMHVLAVGPTEAIAEERGLRRARV
jgi:hypothetical protein